jgi:hypothetical protein
MKMRTSRLVRGLTTSVVLSIVGMCCTARIYSAIVVAAADSSDQEKSRADFVCDNKDDQVELGKSLALGRRGKTKVDVNPKLQQTVECTLNHAVEWLPGTYSISETLEIPDATNCVIRAEGTTLEYQKSDGDCVVIRGMNRCRYSFGTIQTNGSGAALCIRPTEKMPALMSFVNFAGLIGTDAKGTGLLLDPSQENVCVNRFEGTDVLGFERGVYVGGAGSREGSASTHGKCDTNWFWLSYVRLCGTCVEESANGVDCSVWEVNVDASLPNSVAIRAAGKYSKWFVIMGTYTFEKKNLAIVLEPGATNCVIEVHPPISEFAWEDRSGSDTNVFMPAAMAPKNRMSKFSPTTNGVAMDHAPSN